MIKGGVHPYEQLQTKGDNSYSYNPATAEKKEDKNKAISNLSKQQRSLSRPCLWEKKLKHEEFLKVSVYCPTFNINFFPVTEKSNNNLELQ